MTDESNDDLTKMQRRRFVQAAGLGATGLATGLAGCAGSQSENEQQETTTTTETAREETDDSGGPVEGGTLVWGHSEVTQELDIHIVQTAASSRFLSNVHETLVGLTDGLEVSSDPNAAQAGLASDWSTNDDRTEYTFTLRDGVTFHDGSTLTSADVKYSFERIMDPELGARYSDVFAQVEAVEAPDDSTVVLRMSERYNPLLRQLAFLGTAIIPEGSGPDQSDTPTGTGPFTFESRQQGNKAVLKGFDDYWGEGPYLDTLEERSVTDPDTRLTGVQEGTFDYINDIPLDNMQEMIDNPGNGLQTQTWRPLAFNHIYFHNDRPPFDSVEWRRAIEFAIDKQQLVEGALFGQGEAIETPSYPNSPFRNDDIEPRGVDHERARSLIEESPYGIDEFAPITFKVTTNYPWHVTAATIMQQSLSQAGIQIEIQELQWGDWLSQVTADMDYRMAMVNWFGGWEPAQMYRGLWHSEGSFNAFAYESDRYDQAVENAETAATREEEVQYYREAQQILHEELPSPFLWFRDGAMAGTEAMGGMDTVLNPNNTMVEFGEAWLDE